jgi:predicted nucleotidyltransferase/HEPN domain-containing protein
MKQDINHLPERKQQELKTITQIICDIANPEMIILFGSHARGDWVEDKYDKEHYRYQSDFDILVLVQTKNETTQGKLEREIEEKLDQEPNVKTPTSIIVHDVEFLNRRLSKAQYFFSDIKKEGIFLYNTEQFQLKEPKELSNAERQKIAKEDFDYWMIRAKDFYDNFAFSFEKERYNQAAFMLHQTTERLYTAILLVFTRYKPKSHDLLILRKFANTIDPELAMVFPLDTTENKHLFKLLRNAYVDARYKPSYVITEEELSKLGEQVNYLKHLVEKLCYGKIASFTKEQIN